MVDYLITPASGTAAISDSSGVSTSPGANKLWASGTNLFWGTTQVDGGGGGGTTINFSPVIQAMDMSGANDAMDRFLNDKMIPAIRDASREGTVVINEDGIEKSPTA